jgi:hypothetical protein
MMSELVIQEPDLAEILKGKLTKAVRDYTANEPRSRQASIGASELGNPCDKAMALKSLGYDDGERRATGNDPWAAFIGTSVHYGLEKVFRYANQQRPVSDYTNGLPYNWQVETRVQIAAAIKGTADLYDLETATVIDHKVPADAVMDKARKGQVSATYRVQIQSYGYGFKQLGYDVRNVAIAFWPRGTGAWLGGAHVIVYPYDETVVTEALSRWYALVNAAIELDLENFPERASLLATADAPCRWCPFFDITGRKTGALDCKGHGRK